MPNPRATFRVGLIGGVTLALAVLAQQIAASPEMRSLGMLIVVSGFGITGIFAARESGNLQRKSALSAGAVGGLIAGVLVSLAFVATSLLLSLDPENLHVLQSQVEQQLTPAQFDQLQQAQIDLKTLTQFSLGLTVACCGVGFPFLGLLMGALGGMSASALFPQTGK